MESESSWSWRAPLESSSLISLLREGSAKPDCSCPGVFWMSPSMETPQHFWAALFILMVRNAFFLSEDQEWGPAFCLVPSLRTPQYHGHCSEGCPCPSHLYRPSLFVSEVHCSVLSCRLLNHLCQEVVIDVLQKHPGLLVPGSFVPSTDFTVIEVTHGDQDVQTWDLFQLSGQVLMYFFFLMLIYVLIPTHIPSASSLPFLTHRINSPFHNLNLSFPKILYQWLQYSSCVSCPSTSLWSSWGHSLETTHRPLIPPVCSSCCRH